MKIKKVFKYLIPHLIVWALMLLVLGFMTYLMLNHNPQGEFRDNLSGKYHFDPILGILSFWAAPFLLLLNLPILIYQLAVRSKTLRASDISLYEKKILAIRHYKSSK